MADVMHYRGVFRVWHYLDDFWTCGPVKPDTLCLTNLQGMISVSPLTQRKLSVLALDWSYKELSSIA